MNQHLATIHLHGPLGERFGERHQFAVATPIEAVQALDANYPGFLAAFAQHKHYALYADGHWRDGDEAAGQPFSRELHICPMIEGRAFLGAALVGALFPAIAGTAMATIIGGVLFAGLLLGLSFLLTPKVPKTEMDEKDENYAFTGPENVTGQGAAVPLVYGRVHAGSVVVSAGLDLGTDLAATTPTPAPVPGGASTAVEPGLSPPPGGWPPIVNDSKGRPGPQGWRLVGTTNVMSNPQEAFLTGGSFWKQVDLWQHPTATTYFYNRVRGFYSSTLRGEQPNEPDYQPGGHR